MPRFKVQRSNGNPRRYYPAVSCSFCRQVTSSWVGFRSKLFFLLLIMISGLWTRITLEICAKLKVTAWNKPGGIQLGQYSNRWFWNTDSAKYAAIQSWCIHGRCGSYIVFHWITLASRKFYDFPRLQNDFFNLMVNFPACCKLNPDWCLWTINRPTGNN